MSYSTRGSVYGKIGLCGRIRRYWGANSFKIILVSLGVISLLLLQLLYFAVMGYTLARAWGFIFAGREWAVISWVQAAVFVAALSLFDKLEGQNADDVLRSVSITFARMFMCGLLLAFIALLERI